MSNIISADFGKRHLEEDLQPIMMDLVQCFIDHFGEEPGKQLAHGVCASLNNLSEQLEKELNGRTTPGVG